MSSVGEALGAAVDALRAGGVEDPRLDAELLLADATGRDRAALIAHPETQLEGAAARRFAEMVRRRVRREPVAYILGRRWFRNLELRCDRRALIPRPETELLVELGLELGDKLAARRGERAVPGEAEDREVRRGAPAPARSGEGRAVSLLDIGTGTGAIALAIADERPDWHVTATDTSPQALALARENAELHGLADRVTLIEGTLPPKSDPPPDIVLANLPYVRDDEWPGLAPEIRDFEPRSALTAGENGLDAIREVVAAIASRWQSALPLIALELAPDQAEPTATLLQDAGWQSTETRRDLAGRDRVVIGHP